jgi:hypothetical protein
VPTVVVTASAAALRLSDTVEVTLTASGSPPLRVELPKELLDPASAVAWQVTPVGTPAVSPDGTTWVQKFKLSPFLPGESLVVRFNAIQINGTDATPELLTFRVETSLRNPTAADARPVTGIEPLPPRPASDPPLIAGGLALLTVLVVLLAVVLAIARKRKPKPLTVGEWVRGQLGTLQAERLRGALGETEFVNRLADLFREYLARRFGVDAGHRTTAEVLAATGDRWDADTRAAVERLLASCDAVKFAGAWPTATECDDLFERVGRLVNEWEEAGRHRASPQGT